MIEAHLKRPLPTDFERIMNEREAVTFKQELQPVPGIVEVLEELTEPKCVASSGTHEKMRTTLGTTGLYSYFENHIFSATEVERGKPHPDLFLYAAEKMGTEPSRCVVVEDSIPGVQGAISAGMKVLGYARLTSKNALMQAGAQVFSNMLELPQLLKHF